MMETKEGKSGSQGGKKRRRPNFGGNNEETSEPPPQPRPQALPHRLARETALPVMSNMNEHSTTDSIPPENLLRQMTHNVETSRAHARIQQVVGLALNPQPPRQPPPQQQLLQQQLDNLLAGPARHVALNPAHRLAMSRIDSALLLRFLGGSGGSLLQDLQSQQQQQQTQQLRAQQRQAQLQNLLLAQQPQEPARQQFGQDYSQHQQSNVVPADFLQTLALQIQLSTAALASSTITNVAPVHQNRAMVTGTGALSGGSSLSPPVNVAPITFLPIRFPMRRPSNAPVNSVECMRDLPPCPALPSAGASGEEPSGRGPLIVYKEKDEGRLTPYQCLARKHLEYFEADLAKVEEGAQGRNKAIVLGQVGIRCRFCAHLKRMEKAPAAAFYPSKLSGIYQSAQNIINSHLAKDCTKVPKELREKLLRLGNRKSAPGSGKAYWAEDAAQMGIFEDENGLRLGPETVVATPTPSAAASSTPLKSGDP